MKRAVLLAALWLASSAHAADLGVNALFEMLGRERPAKAAFTERKFLALLDQPVVSSGELVFTPPERLEKRTLRPKPERVAVDRDTVTLERNGRTHTLRLRENPAIAVLVESIRATLLGDLPALTRAYSAAVKGDAQGWRMTLRPLEAELAAMVERIEIAGVQGQVRTVEIFQADGDRSAMTITPAGR